MSERIQTISIKGDSEFICVTVEAIKGPMRAVDNVELAKFVPADLKKAVLDGIQWVLATEKAKYTVRVNDIDWNPEESNAIIARQAAVRATRLVIPGPVEQLLKGLNNDID